MKEKAVIYVGNVSKAFKLPHEKQGSLKSVIVNFWRHKKGYEIQDVLKDVSFEVKEGEFLGIVGRNGSGKSTLLKILSGIYSPTSGDVRIEGRLTPFIELGVGFSPELTGRENIYLNGSLLGFTRKQMQNMYDDIVEFAELERFMDQKLKNYSSGMQVRLAFSIAIRAQSDILVLDEVLAVGDEAFQRKCYDYFYSLKRNNKTVIIVTHDMAAVENFCTRAILIEGGKILKAGDPRNVAQSYKELFLPPEQEQPEEVFEEPPVLETPKRWGTKKIIFKKVKVTKNQKNITIHLQMDTKEQVKSQTTLAYTVKSADGSSLFGDSFEIGNDISDGTEIDAAITFSNILSKGEYYIDISVRDVLSGIYYDFWSDCTSFDVIHAPENALHILTNSKITIETQAIPATSK